MYNHRQIEQKWQKYWSEHDTFACVNPELENSHKPKFYALDMFPYPSGAGLHVGHPKGYTATDIIARYKHAKGFHVLHPMGWDAFGLPAENYAIKTGTHPAVTTAENINHFREQLKKFGFSYDWNREVNTTDPAYYKWSQWIFLKLFEAGLAYESDKPINFCPSCKTGLANEEVVDGKCERCGDCVEKKAIRQWILAITKYADRLLTDIDRLDWPEGIKEQQRNWIGKSEGCQFAFRGVDCPDVEVFTTRIDTVFSGAFVVIAPDHPKVQQYIISEQRKECEKYIKKTQEESDIERTKLDKQKTGVFTGSYVINPFNNEKLPVWIGDFVLGNYGTGAVFGDAHDERDWEFAKKYEIPLKQSIAYEYIFDGVYTPKIGVETLKRKCIDVILENGNGEIFLIDEYNSDNDSHAIHFVGGGIEEGENEEEALLKEIREESGYIDVEIVNAVPMSYIYSKGYRHTKGKNQETLAQFWHVKLKSEKRVSCEIEENKHTGKWYKKDEVTKSINWGNHLLMWHTFISGPQYAMTSDGILVNSGEFNGLTSAEARGVLTEKAEKEGFGKKITNYKLRDWIFSRQRYWGEPIPLIHIKDENYDALLKLNFRNPDVIEKIIVGGKNHHTRALNPDEPNRAFHDVSIGDNIIFFDQKKGENFLVKIEETKIWSNLSDLSENCNDLKDIFPLYFGKFSDEQIKNLGKEEIIKIISKRYEELQQGYAKKIEENGIICFKFSVIGKLTRGLTDWLLPDWDLPLKLPEVEKYEPSGDGESPLVTIPEWVNVHLGNNLTGHRETNTMPQWAGSCWYYLRFMDPTNSEAIVDPAVVKYWGEVDSYIGGAEHAVLHLLYARFWHKFLFDIGVVPTDEPFFRLRNVGLILGPDGEKMSKSKGNVVNPDEVIEEYGADTLRLYEMGMADFSDVSPWNTKAIVGSYRLLEKINRLFTTDPEAPEYKPWTAKDELGAMKIMHKTIKKVGEDIENMKFNTAIAAINIMINGGIPTDAGNAGEWKSVLVRLLHPFAPHMAEECSFLMGDEDSVFSTEWPEYIPAMTIDDEVQISIQINGKLRGTYAFLRGVTVEEVRMTVENKPEISKWLENQTVVKEIFIPNKILNIVIK